MSSDLAHKLRRIREYFRLTYDEMVKDLEWYDVPVGELNKETIRQFESSELAVPSHVLNAYSRYCGVPVSALLDEEVQPFFTVENSLRLS